MNAHTQGPPDASQASAVVYHATFGIYNQDSDWDDRRALTWQDLIPLLTRHEVGPKEGTCIVPATFFGMRRKKLEAERIDVAFLDSDAGFTLDEIEAAVRRRGWAAIIASSHSHMTTRTRVKRANWERYAAQFPADMPATPAAFLEEEKHYLPRVAEGARIAEEKGEFLYFEHQRCPKFRIAIPLARPWLAASYPKQILANAAWKERVETLAGALELDHDQACTDTSRLFYLPRRPADGPLPETRVIEGAPCDIFALKAPGEEFFTGLPTQESPPKQRTRKKAKPEQESAEFTDPQTGEVFDLSRWAKHFGARFQIVDALQATKPEVFVGLVADGIKHHIVCVNEREHTNEGQDKATFLVNANQADNHGFVYHCRHGHCDGRDRLVFLRKMLEEGWLSVADLTRKRFLTAEAVGGSQAAGPQRDEEDEHYFQPPLIRYVAGKLPEIVTQAEDALIRSPCEVYQRGPFIVRPGLVRITVPKKGEIETPSLIEMGAHALAEELTRAADWEKFDGRSENWIAIDAPTKVAETLRDRKGQWRLPTIAGIINAPTLRPDGSILATPGYDPATGLKLDLRGLKVPKILDQPTADDADGALQILLDLISTFPFEKNECRSVALSAILTGVIRRSLRTAPLHAFSAPAAGSGKSILVDIACLMAAGHEAPVIAQGKNEEEMEKRIGAMLLSGDPFIPIDNCEAPLGGDILCQILTQTSVRARILGRSEIPKLPSTALVTATGNNLVLVGDMTRRAIIARIDPKCERPELRVFDRDPVEMVKADRGKYVAAALTILRAFHVAGRPQQKQSKPLGSFTDWSEWVRGALLWLGEADPVKTMEDARNDDPKLEAMRSVMEQWQAVIKPEIRVTVRELIERATAHRTGDWGKPDFIHPDFREALLKIANDRGNVNSFRLGKWLSANKGRIVDGYSIEADGQEKGIGTWKLSKS
ncbi:MAG TPA: hypothetical protein VNS22_01920 [Geminicoccus sp.]|uniref:hypothetical protein n=1 Tax=Geminicoccus sp. TaxID=2024832 RepID=UPI002C411A9E|nr:hypothetical protein [Geminicoccus sp.]HWL67120.1 hypothetical protein [Geminicoccus sp.]